MLRRVAGYPTTAVLLALLGGALFCAREAAAQSVCAAKCREDAACLEKCEKARKGRLPAKDTKSKSSSTTSDPAKDDWRSGIFDSTSKGGGGY